MNKDEVDVIIIFFVILSMCMMWFVIGYYKGKAYGMDEERKEILNIVDSIHKQNDYIIKGGKK